MSQSIVITGKFHNNKTRTAGLHNPANNRTYNESERKHVWNMVNEYIKPVVHKFKSIEFKVFLQSGDTLYFETLVECLNSLRSDTISR